MWDNLITWLKPEKLEAGFLEAFYNDEDSTFFCTIWINVSLCIATLCVVEKFGAQFEADVSHNVRHS